MLSFRTRGEGFPVVFFVHWLSGSGASWVDVTDPLADRFRCVTIDLPGFGQSTEISGYTLQEMTNAVMEVIRHVAAPSWMLAGHSMGAKVATAVARCAEDGNAGLTGLQAIVLLAGSPPTPEPMDESRRTKMQSWFDGDEGLKRSQAEKFIEMNCAAKLDGEVKERAVLDVLTMKRAAWLAWLEGGSREDWTERVGVLRTPTLIVAGEKDADLGEDAQRALMLPHFAHGEVRVLPGAKHLLPLEFPAIVAEWIEEQSAVVARGRTTGPALPAQYRKLIDSDRVSPQTRAVLLMRARPDNLDYEPLALTVEHLATLRAVADRVVPQGSEAWASNTWIDLAARVDRQLAESKGNGWRYDILPPDAEAYHAGLHTLDAEAHALHGAAFLALSEKHQDGLLEEAAAGKLEAGLLRRLAGSLGMKPSPGNRHALNAEQMQRWFEEVRGDLVRAYVAHPATLARMDYNGIADGADADTMTELVQLSPSKREAWEPVASAEVTR